MRLLIAIPACVKYDYGDKPANGETEGRREAVRATWATQLLPGMDLRFFYGRTQKSLGADEVRLSVRDDYQGLSEKFQGMCAYCLVRGYDFGFFCGDDTWVYPARLAAVEYSRHDYSGNYPWSCHKCYIPGGTGIFLSRKAMQLVVDAPITSYSDDLWVGSVLKGKGIVPHHLDGFISGFDAHYAPLPLPANTVTAHAVRPADMYRIHSESKHEHNSLCHVL